MKPDDFVLIVEDDQEWRDIIRSVIRKNFSLGCKTTKNYQNSIKFLRSFTPLVVILDLNLDNNPFDEPQWMGWRLAELATEKHIPLIIVTAFPRDDRIARAFKSYKVIDFFDKKNFTNRLPEFIKDIELLIKDGDEKNTSLFISYSHQDKSWLAKFTPHLQVLTDKGSLNIWDDTMIRPGTKWRKEIEDALSVAKAALLLVTPEFLTSEFIKRYELPVLINAAEQRDLKIYWVAVEPSLYQLTCLSEVQAINDPDKPLASLPAKKANQEIVNICKKIINEIN